MGVTEPAPLRILRNGDGAVVGEARALPHSVALPGGLRAVAAGDAAGAGGACGACGAGVVLRWRGRCASADAVKGAEIVVVGGKLLANGVRLGDLGCGGVAEVVFLEGDGADGGGAVAGPWCCGVDGGRGGDGGDVDCDVVAYVWEGATAGDVTRAVAEGLTRQLAAAAAVGAGGDVVVRHFAVWDGGVVLSVVRTVQEDEEDEDAASSIERRKREHEALMLPMTRPVLRRARAVDFAVVGSGSDGGALGEGCGSDGAADGGCLGRLADVHVGIKGHGLGDTGVSVHVVRSRYLYCHYMQDRFNDSGWGCAYRSLQTLMSWCVTEGLASFPGGVLPTHREIQGALVAIGDKPSKFVGSREWIGANECCYALEKLTGVSSRILHVSRGSEMESKGRELARHFDDQGSPVMIGGGVLAWTILGVARDSRTGKAKFLILDPHYEGADKVDVIQAKGWVAWKGANIFKPNAFYNLCMPQQPTTV